MVVNRAVSSRTTGPGEGHPGADADEVAVAESDFAAFRSSPDSTSPAVEVAPEVEDQTIESEQAQQSMLRDTDAILGRLESRIVVEQTAIDALLNRLARNPR
jgi:hypothetical protein